MTSKLFSELGLSPALLKAIDRLGYEKAAPIQSEAIPLIMGGSDVSANPRRVREKPQLLEFPQWNLSIRICALSKSSSYALPAS